MSKMPKPRIVAKRVVEVMEADSDCDSIKKIGIALKKKGYNSPPSTIYTNLVWLQDQYMVGRFGRRYLLLTKTNKMGMCNTVLVDLITNLSQLSDANQNAIWCYLMKGLEYPHGLLKHCLSENNKKLRKIATKSQPILDIFNEVGG